MKKHHVVLAVCVLCLFALSVHAQQTAQVVAAVKPAAAVVVPPPQCEYDMEWAGGGGDSNYKKSPCALICPVSITTAGASVNVEYTDPLAIKQRPDMVTWCKHHVAELHLEQEK